MLTAGGKLAISSLLLLFVIGGVNARSTGIAEPEAGAVGSGAQVGRTQAFAGTTVGRMPVSLPIRPPLVGSSSTPAPGPSSGGSAAIQIDFSHPGATISAALFGVDEMGGYAQGIWNAHPSGSATPLLYPAAATATSAMHLGMVRLEPLVNSDVSCQPKPGGDDCGDYRWQDHVGPTASRPGQNPEMGPDDYMTMLRQSAPGATPFVVVNMETATVQDIADEVAYMDGTSGSMARWRTTNTGSSTPYGVVYWEVGNEEREHVDALRRELADPARNPGGCPDYTADGATDFTVGQLYGCLLKGYSTAMHSAASGSASTVGIRIVADFTSTSDWMSGLMSTAGGAFDDVDYHDYPEPSDASNIVFDSDGQWSTFTVSPVRGALPQEVTYAFWATGAAAGGAPTLEAELDGVPLMLRHNCGSADCVGAHVTSGDFSMLPQLFVGNTMTSPGRHQLAVTACSPAGVSSTGSCPSAGNGSSANQMVVNLRHVSTALGIERTSDLLSSRQGMAPLSCGTWRPDPDSLVPTGTPVTQTATPSTPWRLSAGDFATAATANLAHTTGLELNTIASVLSARPGTGVFIGEYADFAGCDATPLQLVETQQAGLVAVQRLVAYLTAAGTSALPVQGAAVYQLNNYARNLPDCAGWALVREVGGTTGGRPDCLASNRPNAAYLTALGADLGLAGQLGAAGAGTAEPLSITGPTVDLPRLIDAPPSPGVPAISGVAYHYPDGTTRVLLVNTLAWSSVATSVGGAAFTRATATTVAGGPDSLNTDAQRNAVAAHSLSTSISNGVVAVTLPPFSCTLLVLG